jgi:hypothetical protein
MFSEMVPHFFKGMNTIKTGSPISFLVKTLSTLPSPQKKYEHRSDRENKLGDQCGTAGNAHTTWICIKNGLLIITP